MGVLYLFVRDGKVFIPPSFWKVSWLSAGGSAGVRLSVSRLSACILALWSIGALVFYALEQEYVCEDEGSDCKKKVQLFDAFYFAFITLSTIGYGDIVPSNLYSKLFLVVFAFLGLGLFSTFLDVMGSWRTSLLQHLKTRASFGDLLEAMIVLLVVLGAGTMGLSWIEDLEMVDALYLCVASATTVGYGDLKPLTFQGKVFVIALAMCSISTIGYVTSCVGDLIQPDSDTAIGFGGDETQWSLSMLDRLFGRRGGKQEFSLSASGKMKLFLFSKIFILLLLAVLVIRHFEPHLSYTDSFYWSIMTLTTIGYGDVAPSSKEGKIAQVILCLLGLGLVSVGTGVLGEWRKRWFHPPLPRS
uniref:Potassium channel domain-containing protein n=1 Tax=Hanusia phi TaxID=3032 RepID=A0A6T7Q894_9CRYP|mmetsp:Transcript_2374/g.5581  ORF Transcript_2374/g.5581 Transcript_2374/m.5581 type:complete len:358 (+) Transcript_2374:45-1118(+)